jgi:hypothetical protein
MVLLLIWRKKISPTVAMAEASLISQQIAFKEATNFEAMILLQKEEFIHRKENENETRQARLEEQKLDFEERKNTGTLLQKIIEKLCPEEDPAERFANRKRKLDELRAVLGEEIYAARLQQLWEELLKSAAM